jgi:hypothetical protein
MKTRHLNKAQALAITRKIKADIELLNALIIEAWEGEAHLALGYPDWVSYAKAEFPKFKLSPETRKAAVIQMRKAGMSTRAAAAAIGVDQKTVVNDTASSQKSEENSSVGATPPAAMPQPRRTAKPGTGDSIRDRVTAYEKVAAEHPTWQVKQIGAHLGVDQKTARRLGYCANAPAEVKRYLYDGIISIAAVEAVFSPAHTEHLLADDLLNVIRKIVGGQIPSTSTTALREVMDTVTQTHGKTRLRWLDPVEAMTYEQLKVALLDEEADTLTAQRTRQERAKTRAQVTDLDKMLYGPKTYDWLDQVDVRLNTLVTHVEEVLTSNSLMGSGGNPALHARLREVGKRFFDIAEHVEELLEEKGQPTKKPNLTVVPTQVETDADGTVVITGTVL